MPPEVESPMARTEVSTAAVTFPTRRAGPPLNAEASAALLAAIDRGEALPTEWFTDRSIFDAELAAVHRRSWHFVAHRGEVAEPGDVHPRQLAGVPIVLVRGDDGAVRGFVNICRHRGHPVVMEAGNQRSLRCLYHAWTYDLDGALRAAPRSRGDERFDRADFGLLPIQVEEWGPMIWANLDLDAPPLSTWIEGMPERLLANGLDVDQCSYGFDHEWEIDANWKVFQDNTIECYHCPTTHPELSVALEMHPSLQEMHVGGERWIWHRIPFREGIGDGLTWAAKDGKLDYYYHWVFPTTYLQYAGRGFDIGSVDVVAPDRIRFRHVCFMPAGTPAETLELGQQVLPLDPTIWQDVGICNRVQEGHASGMAPTGRTLAEPEFLLQRMHRLIVQMMSAAPAG
jgi:choline monooxygenase